MVFVAPVVPFAVPSVPSVDAAVLADLLSEDWYRDCSWEARGSILFELGEEADEI